MIETMSKIFTQAEVAAIEKRKAGDLDDKTGIFHNRVKPKIIELRDRWFVCKDELEKLI